MAENTSIEWTSATWTPIRAIRLVGDTETGWVERIGWHCEHASPGCKNCYAEGINRRLGTGQEFKPVNLIHVTPLGDQRGDVSMFLDERMLLEPLRWKKPREIFVCSMTDLFASFVREDWIIKLFAVMALAPRHTFQVLTKRPDRMASFLLSDGAGHRIRGRAWSLLGKLPKYKHEGILQRPWPLPNVVIGASVEDQRFADERREPMARIAAAGWPTWVSYEPALGPVAWRGWEFVRCVISGGESGVRARPSHPDWHRATRDFCAAHGIDFGFKQWGQWGPARDAAAVDRGEGIGGRLTESGRIEITPNTVQRLGKKASGRLLDGVTHDGFPCTTRESAPA